LTFKLICSTSCFGSVGGAAGSAIFSLCVCSVCVDVWMEGTNISSRVEHCREKGNQNGKTRMRDLDEGPVSDGG